MRSRRGIVNAIRDVVSEARNAEDAELFAGQLDAMLDSLEYGDAPERSDPGALTNYVSWLAGMTIEDEAQPIGATRASLTVSRLASLLPAELVSSILYAALIGGHVRPGADLAAQNEIRDDPQVNVLFSTVWDVIGNDGKQGGLAWLSALEEVSVDDALERLANWLMPASSLPPIDLRLSPINPPELKFSDINIRPADPPDRVLETLFARRMWVAPGFQWPPYTREGVYWWRALIKPECIDILFPLSDTADFHATNLIRFIGLFKLFAKTPTRHDERVPEYVVNNIKLSLLWFKYWLDEPAAEGNDGGEMTFWSENHQIQFAQSQYLVGLLFRDEVFPRGSADPKEPRRGRAHRDIGLSRLRLWLDHRLRFGFSEWNSPVYYNEDFPPLFNLVDFWDENYLELSNEEKTTLREIKIKAATVIDLLMFDLARFTCRGSFGVSAGRAYWESKSYGWEQSVGETVEILLGTRGDFVGTEPTAIAFATSSYDLPEALIAIARDRELLDRKIPFIDRSRVSITFDEAATLGIGMEKEDDIVFWWGNMAYFDHTLEATRKVVEAHDNLKKTQPFKAMYSLESDGLHQVLYDLAETAAGAGLAFSGAEAYVLLPFPLNIVAVGLVAAGLEATLEGLWHLLGDIWSGIKSGARWLADKLGFDVDDDPPKIPDSALLKLLEGMLIEFNRGSVLSRANLYLYSNGDAQLSSVQNHLVSALAFQKHPWQATLGCDAAVWTTAPLTQTHLSSILRGWLEFFKDIAAFRPTRAITDLALPLPPVHDALANQLGHDGPNYWSGSVALPMIVQHENALIAAYNLPNEQRVASDAATHAWFPKDQFDDTEQANQSGGTWTFGRKGDGFVALFSAREVDWTNEDGNAWNNKELRAEGGGNLWVCLVGNTTTFQPEFRAPLSPAETAKMSEPDFPAKQAFKAFKEETLATYINVSGVGTWNELHCSFDIPRAKAPSGASPRLELFFDQGKGRFAGQDLSLDEFPRFENRYASETFALTLSGGLRPQVLRFQERGGVTWGARRYSIRHPQTGLVLEHDLDNLIRRHNHQDDEQVAKKASERRLSGGSLTPVRRRSPGRR